MTAPRFNTEPDALVGLTFTAPAFAGYLDLVPGFSVAAARRPSWLHRWAMRVCFGWQWRDA